MMTDEILIYQDEQGNTNIDVRIQQETVWLTQKQMAELFDKNVRTINEHINNVYEERELQRDSTIRKFRIVQTEGKRKVETAMPLIKKSCKRSVNKSINYKMP